MEDVRGFWGGTPEWGTQAQILPDTPCGSGHSARMSSFTTPSAVPVEIVAVTQGSRDIPAFLQRRMHRV